MYLYVLLCLCICVCMCEMYPPTEHACVIYRRYNVLVPTYRTYTYLYPPTEHTPTCTHLQNIHVPHMERTPILVPTYRTYMCYTWNVYLYLYPPTEHTCATHGTLSKRTCTHLQNIHVPHMERTPTCTHLQNIHVPPTEYTTSLYPPTEHACATHRTNRTYLYCYKTYNLLVLLTEHTELSCTAYITYKHTRGH